MQVAIIAVFLIGYVLIAAEHVLKVNKTATAIITGVVCWALFMMSSPEEVHVNKSRLPSFAHERLTESTPQTRQQIFQDYVSDELAHHLGAIAEILFFLLGAMTIVELIDAHHGFHFITNKITTNNPTRLLWLICWITFFLSAVLDNLTSTIVMISLTRKLVSDKEMKLIFAGMIIIAANAGGCWTPLGDVTTTMLWIGGQISTLNIMKALFLPGVVCMLLPLSIVSFMMRGKSIITLPQHQARQHAELVGGGKLMLALGIGILLGVPAFKIVAHLPPYLGMLLGLGILWVVSEFIHPELDDAVKKNYTVAGALSRIDVPSILFFLGILLAVGALDSIGILSDFAGQVNKTINNQGVVVTLIGLLSAVVDNVPLVAASMGMYDIEAYHTDHFLWKYLAYCAGTGGSILIIGSAAGVAAMGMEKIDFVWYLKKISWLALLGYFAGAGVYLLIS